MAGCSKGLLLPNAMLSMQGHGTAGQTQDVLQLQAKQVVLHAQLTRHREAPPHNWPGHNADRV